MCTGIQIKTTKGAPIYGRTMEFADDLASQLLVIPKGYSFTGLGPMPGLHGKTWVSNYNITGLNANKLNWIIDGINSEGLCVGAFYFIGYAGYMNVSAEEATNSICSVDLPTYLLSTCKNVEEVRNALQGIKVNKGSYEPSNTTKPISPTPLHYNIHDADGKVLVVEYIGGELQISDNKIGVLTNSPEFNWHVTNLKNYINLSASNTEPMVLKDTGYSELKISPTGQGSGFLGMPGDYTPPSRFIRAVAYSQNAETDDSPLNTVFQAFHILNAFDIPIGTIRQQGKNGLSLEYTQWTVASDLQNKIFYFHTAGNRTVRMIDLSNWSFKDGNIVHMEINQDPTIINMTDCEVVTADLVTE